MAGAAVALAVVMVVSLEGGGSKRQDDGGMEEVVTWRLFVFVFIMHKLVSQNHSS